MYYLKLLSLLFIMIPFFSSCNDDSWKEEFIDIQNELELVKQELANQKQIVETLKDGISISKIEYGNDTYKILFTNGESITLTNGRTPIINIGDNNHWFVDGIDTGVQAIGENGKTPEVNIGSDGYWYINGVCTNIKAAAKDGNDAPIIKSIIDTSSELLFIFSDGTKISCKIHSKIGDIEGVGIMGASLIYSANDWTKIGCDIAGCKLYNKAEAGVGTPQYFANKLWRNNYCSEEEFNSMDILVIQFASSGDIYHSRDSLYKTTNEYTSKFDVNNLKNPFHIYDSAQCLDYILKYWQKKCRDQEFNKHSKWYNEAGGKPCRLMFVTHWHDARTEYNESIRLLAKKWGAGLCALDQNIGFSKNQPLPDNTQVSVLYSIDTQWINGVEFGWHPLRGKKGNYIQKKMGNIFAHSLITCFAMKN